MGNGGRPTSRRDAIVVTTPDSELIQECLQGDTNAFGTLVERYQDRLYNSLLRTTQSPDEAAEIAQQAFVYAFRKLASFRGDSAFYSWLFRIAMNAMISEKRRQRRQAVSLEANREKSGSEPIDGDLENDPSRPLELDERRLIVERALAELSEEFRTVIVLKEIEDLKYEQIAEILDCPIGTVRSRLHRAREELRLKLHVLLSQDGGES